MRGASVLSKGSPMIVTHPARPGPLSQKGEYQLVSPFAVVREACEIVGIV